MGPITLALKLLLFVILLSQGISSERFMFLLLGAVMIFLYQVGILKISLITRLVYGPNHPPRQADTPSATSENLNQNLPKSLTQKIVEEVKCLLGTFILSLSPNWEAPEVHTHAE